MIQDTGNIMRGKRRSFTPSRMREFGKERVRKRAGNFGKSVAVEEEKGRLAMIRAQPV